MIFAHVGNQGAGKTLGSVVYVKRLSEITGQQIVSNAYLNFSYIYFEDWRQMVEVAPNNSIILFDEIDTAIDARNFKSVDQILFTHWFKQLRKRGITFFYTCQRIKNVDVRVRDLTDYVAECEKDWLWNKLSVKWFDTQAGLERALFIKKVNVHDHFRVFPLFDSFKIIKSTMV